MNANAKTQAGQQYAQQQAVQPKSTETLKIDTADIQWDSATKAAAPGMTTTYANSPSQMYVLDTTAQPGNAAGRTHDMVVGGLVKPFTFHYGKSLAMPKEVALKFLKHQEFKLTDVDGNVLAYDRAPKQPEELGAGETFSLSPDETIARFGELSTIALQNRCISTFGGEKFATSTDRDAMTAFLAAAKPKLPKITQRRAVDGEENLLDLDDDEDMPPSRAKRYPSDGHMSAE